MGAETPVQAAVAVDFAAIAKEASALEEPGASTETPAAPTEVAAVPPVEGEPVKPVEAPVEKKVEPAKTEKSSLEVNFEKLVAKQQEFRKETEASKPGIELANTLGVQNAQALAKALVTRNPLDALAAIGFSYKDVADAVIGKGGGEKKPVPKPGEAPPKPEQPQEVNLPPQVQEMLREHQQMKAERQRQSVEAEIKKVVTENAGKLKLVSGLDAVGEVTNVLEEMYARGGFPQGSTPQEIIRIAAEEAETRLARQKERWSKVLTPAEKPATVPPKATETPKQPAQDGGGQTLTNDLAAAAGSPPSTAFDLEATLKQLKDDPFLTK